MTHKTPYIILLALLLALLATTIVANWPTPPWHVIAALAVCAYALGYVMGLEW